MKKVLIRLFRSVFNYRRRASILGFLRPFLPNKLKKFPESRLAHKYLDGLKGVEIGGSAHNPFGLNTLNVDYTDSLETPFKRAEIEICGEAMIVDIVANGEKMPVSDESFDFVINSHVIEHIFDPIGALKEWHRIIKPGGYIFLIVPITEFVPFETRSTTLLAELIRRHEGTLGQDEVLRHTTKSNLADSSLSDEIRRGILEDRLHGHWTVFDLEQFKEICHYLNLRIIDSAEADDKVGNGFTVVIRK